MTQQQTFFRDLFHKFFVRQVSQNMVWSNAPIISHSLRGELRQGRGLCKVPSHASNVFLKVSVLIVVRTKQKICVHTSVFVLFSPIHTKTLENDENDWDLGLRMC